MLECAVRRFSRETRIFPWSLLSSDQETHTVMNQNKAICSAIRKRLVFRDFSTKFKKMEAPGIPRLFNKISKMETFGIPRFINKISRNGGAWYSEIFQQNFKKWRRLVFRDFSTKFQKWRRLVFRDFSTKFQEMEAPGIFLKCIYKINIKCSSHSQI
jgi:hypothetical protein